LNDYSFVSDTQMDNRHLVTRRFGGVPSKNHHGDLPSTSPQFFAAQFFRSAGPIRAADQVHAAYSNFTSTAQKLMRYNSLQRFVCLARALWVLIALVSACRADLKHALAGHSMSAKAKQKSMKTQLSKDFV
jgi:hypothetical protein